jgi:DNA helicase-2/ATP-dependent DNA helicase PcrA
MEEGDLVQLNCFKNGKDEAIGVSDEIEKKIKKKFSYNNVAILVRAIFQTREFEERFLKIGMPYRILGGTKFYERAEIKDCVAYLRLIHQEKDDLAFERIVNNPKRAIGDSTLKNIHEFAKENNLNLERASFKMLEQNLIKPKAKIGLGFFINSLNKWRNDLQIKKSNHVKLLQIVLDESGYSAMLKNKKDLDNENRLENINMMTMHAAKGLEFDVVFLPGWEEGLFPHQKSIEEKGQKGLEEERRLAYVGITRAKQKAIISFSMNRFYQGDWIDSMASRFIEELPEKNLEKNSFFDDEANNEDDFEFNQDFEVEEGTRSPGWIRYQKRIK